LVVLYHVYVVGNSIRSLVAYPHCHICILPITSADISAVFLYILPLRRSANPHIHILPVVASVTKNTQKPIRDLKNPDLVGKTQQW